MGKRKQKEEQSQEEQEVQEYQQDGEQEEYVDEYITRDQLKEQLKNRISHVEGEQKIAFAALFSLFEKQEELNDQEDKEIQAIKHKYRLKTQEILNKSRKVIAGQSTQNILVSSNTLLTTDEKSKSLKDISIPDFWPTVIKNSSFGAIIQKSELPAIDSITNVVVKFDPSNKELNIYIHFGQNSILSDKILQASLTEKDNQQIVHKHDIPNYKSHYTKSESGFFNLFAETPEADLIGLYEYWLNFYQIQLPQALPFYFELRQGTYAQTSENIDDDLQYQEDQDEDRQQQVHKPQKKSKVQKPEKPQCKQQ